MNTNKEDSELKKIHSEITGNRVNSFNAIVLSIIAISNIFISWNLDKVNQKLEDAKFFETTIDHLAADAENREIALSMLYSLYILEEKQPKHREMLIDISDTIIRSNIQNNSQDAFILPDKKKAISQKALIILEKLDPNKKKEIDALISSLQKRTDPTNPKPKDNKPPPNLNIIQNNNASVSSLLNTTEKAKDKKGLVFIQYNNQNKKENIDKFRETLSEEWNAPGIEFIAEYSSASGKYGDVRFFHTDEEGLANQLLATLNKKYCPEKAEGCFKPINLSGKYKNLPRKQFEIWIDANKIK